MSVQGIGNVAKFISNKYNIFIDDDKLAKLNRIIESSEDNTEKYNIINMFCEAIFGVNFFTICELSRHPDCIKSQNEECTILQKIQKTLIIMERETTQKISELERQIEDLQMTNEELRTNYWNLKHNN